MTEQDSMADTPRHKMEESASKESKEKTVGKPETFVHQPIYNRNNVRRLVALNKLQ
jgi:hypothetical protein